VVVVGMLEWQETDQFDSFPQENRRDAELVRFFKEIGVPPQQLLYLCDAQGHYKQITQKLATFLPQAQPGDLLFFYFCGHGYKLDSGEPCLAAYDAGGEGCPDWHMTALPQLIDQHFPGDRALLTIDCCYSGCMADAVAAHRGRVSYGCLTSSLASETSTGNWTFTEGLIAGLRGQAFTDENNSYTITLREVAEGILADMAFAEEQLASFAVSGAFDPNLILAPARPKPDPHIGRRLEALSEGDWYKGKVIDAQGGKLKIHYYGWDDSDDEWVPPDQTREVTPVQYAVGTAVEVKFKRKWYPARVLKVIQGIHYIHYDDYDAEWDEWVASTRVRLPRK
jgi:hypothetical protein